MAIAEGHQPIQLEMEQSIVVTDAGLMNWLLKMQTLRMTQCLITNDATLPNGKLQKPRMRMDFSQILR